MIIQYIQGKEVNRFANISEAEKGTGIDGSSIRKVIRGQRSSAGGSSWEEDSASSCFDEFLESQNLDKDKVKSFKIWQTGSGDVRFSVATENQEKVEEENKKLLEELKEYSPEYRKHIYEKSDINKVAVEVSIPDLHFGQIISEEECGTAYNLDIAERVYKEKIRELVSQIRGFNIEKFIFPVGNDLFNTEGLSRSTTHGTLQQEADVWQVIYRRGKLLLIWAIDYLSMIAPVEVLIIPGNHDFENMFKMGEVLDAWYRKSEDVKIDNSSKVCKYIKYGKSLIGFEHGKNIKPQELALKLLKDNKHQIEDVEFFEFHCGHFHKEMLNEYNGVKVRFLPSLCPEDSWHREQGYDHSRACQAHIWNKEKGYSGYIQANSM